MAYWYEKENGALLAFEKDCYFRFMNEYACQGSSLRFSFDNNRRFCVDISLPVKVSADSPWRDFAFHIVYDHDFPCPEQWWWNGIKVYPMNRLKPGFHHLILDSSTGCPYLDLACITRSDVCGYRVMKQVLRWINAYCIWERTGVDIDK